MHKMITWRSRKERADFFPYISNNSFWDRAGKIREMAKRCTTKLSHSKNKWCWDKKKKKVSNKKTDTVLPKGKTKVMTIKPTQMPALSPAVKLAPQSMTTTEALQCHPPIPKPPAPLHCQQELHKGKHRKPNQRWHWLAESRSISQSCPWCLISRSRKSGCLNYRSKFILKSINSYGKHMGLKSLRSHYLGLIDTALGGLP